MNEQITAVFEAGVARIGIRRPEKKNALTQTMYAALADALHAAGSDPSINAILLHGTDEVFSAGNDMQDFLTNFSLDDSAPVVRFLHALADTEKPVVAAVNGAAIGIGTTMLLHCDLVYCGENARFQLPFVNLGVVPEAGSSFILTSMLGQRHAAELLMLGDRFDAATALRFGIVNGVLPDSETFAHAFRAASQLAAKPPQALRTTKALMKAHTREAVRDAMRIEAEHFATQLRSAEAQAIIAAFGRK
jgi:enoyl-CoA hydratase/carnithine racemase